MACINKVPDFGFPCGQAMATLEKTPFQMEVLAKVEAVHQGLFSPDLPTGIMIGNPIAHIYFPAQKFKDHKEERFTVVFSHIKPTVFANFFAADLPGEAPGWIKPGRYVKIKINHPEGMKIFSLTEAQAKSMMESANQKK